MSGIAFVVLSRLDKHEFCGVDIVYILGAVFVFFKNILQILFKMIKSIFTLLIFIFLSQVSLSQETTCSRQTSFGDVLICLPILDGYQECYLDSDVKPLADGTEVPSNMVLGFYLNENTHKRRDSLNFIRFDDYFKIYGTKQIKDYDADSEILNQMEEVLAGNFIFENWDLMEKEVDKIGLEIEIGVPIVVDSYKINNDSFTYVLLANYGADQMNPIPVAMTINGVILNNRLVWMAYYLHYQGDHTIVKLRDKSNSILNALYMASK